MWPGASVGGVASASGLANVPHVSHHPSPSSCHHSSASVSSDQRSPEIRGIDRMVVGRLEPCASNLTLMRECASFFPTTKSGTAHAHRESSWREKLRNTAAVNFGVIELVLSFMSMYKVVCLCKTLTNPPSWHYLQRENIKAAAL